MTNEELQEIVAAVIAALKTNGKTIMQLTEVVSLQDSDYFEVSGSRRVSYEYLRGELVDATSDIIDTYTTNVSTAIAGKMDGYDASWIWSSSLRTEANFNAFAAACTANKVIYDGGSGLIMNATYNSTNHTISIWYYTYDSAQVECTLTLSNGSVTLSPNTVKEFATTTSVSALAGRVTTAEGNITSLGNRMTGAEGNILDLYGVKLSYYDVSWIDINSSTGYTEANWNALAAAIAANKVLFYKKNIAHGSRSGNMLRVEVEFYNGTRHAEAWLNDGVVTVEWDDRIIFADDEDVTAIGDRVTALESSVSGMTGSMGALNIGYLNEDDPEFSSITNVANALDLVIHRTKEVFCTMDEYNDMVDAGTIDEDTKYYIFEEE